MSAEDREQPEEAGFHAYADYQSITRDIGACVADAADAYSFIVAKHREHDRLRNEEAAQAHERIYAAAMRLAPEIKRENERPQIGEIYNDWMKDADEVDGAYLEAFDELSLQSPPPHWLETFVMQIRTAAFRLGYLQAGHMESDDGDSIRTEQTEAMFEQL